MISTLVYDTVMIDKQYVYDTVHSQDSANEIDTIL